MSANDGGPHNLIIGWKMCPQQVGWFCICQNLKCLIVLSFIVKTRNFPQGTKANTDKHRFSCSIGTVSIVVLKLISMIDILYCVVTSITTFCGVNVKLLLDQTGWRYVAVLFSIVYYLFDHLFWLISMKTQGFHIICISGSKLLLYL